MLKHTQLTLSRIGQFIEHELKERLTGERVALDIEFCPTSHRTESAARKKGPWEKVAPGFRYGPAYRMVWFRVKGAVPKSWAGKQMGVMAELGGERTAWKDDSPWIGIDEPHSILRLWPPAAQGRKVDLCIQAYTRNPQCRVHRRELPREDLVEEVRGAELVLLNEEIASFFYDCDFCKNLLDSIEETDPSHATILVALNSVCNLFRPAHPDSILRCKKILREALNSINAELRHSITPVGHAHLDTAWLWPLEITHLKMAHTTATQLDLLERYPEYVFVHSQASQYEWIELEYPALFERIKGAVDRGQWEPVGSMWVEADCNLTGGESLVRQFLYGRRYFKRHFGAPTDDMWLPDVFGYSAALPQILEKFGIRYFLTQKISWNQFNKFPHHTFWWQGIDGTKVWTHFPPADTYCADCTPKEILTSVKNYRDHARSDQSLYVFGFGDGGGGPTERHLEFLQRARNSPNLPTVESGRRAVEFFHDARQKSRDLQTWVGELYFELHRGTYTSQAANKQLNRECEFLLRDAELLACFEGDLSRNYPAAKLEEAWKLVLLNQFHDIIPGSSVREVYIDSSRDYAVVQQIGSDLIERSLKAIASNFSTEGTSRPIALFHNSTLPSLATIPWDENAAGPASLIVGEDAHPVQCVHEFGETKLLFNSPHESLGAVCVADLSDRAPSIRTRLKVGPRRLENAEFCVRFDQHGNISSVQSLDDSALEFIVPGKLANLFQLFEDKPLFWSAWDLDAYAYETGRDLIKSESFEVVERGPVRAAVEVVKRIGKSLIRQRISVGSFPGIRFDTEIDWHEEDKLLKVAFPINVNAQRATYEIQFGSVERPTHYNTSWDMARFEVCAQKWADLSEGGYGVALLNTGKYGHDIHGNLMRLSLLRSPKAPDPECDMGLHRFTYVLLPHFDSHHNADVVAAAYALNAPLRTVPLEPNCKGSTVEMPRFVACDNRNLVIEAVKKAEDADRLVVRLYECHNTRGTAELSCAKNVYAAWLADLNENPIQQLDIHDGVVVFDFKPFGIITILLEV